MKKIMIIGSCGSGKTTLALRLGKALDLPVYHLDQYFWLPGWQEAPHEEFIEKQLELIDQESWIIDGNYMRTISLRFCEADTIIFLDIPRWRCLYQAIKRQCRFFRKQRPDLPQGCRSYFDWGFVRFLWYIWRYKTKFRPLICKYLTLDLYDAKIYHIISYEQFEHVLKNF